MFWSRDKKIAAGVLASSVAVIAGLSLLGGGTIRACSAVGYADISPIQLQFDPGVEVDAVAACFGTDCEPVILAGTNGRWSVPQTQEYLQGAQPGSITHVAVRAEADGEVVADRVVELSSERVDGSGWPECPGPHRYLPAVVGVAPAA
ncbi:hypothetical protein [Cellulomonas fimi]|uniref:Uncharacterized protein n=1 Tax=Cellulomonas fimi TaxID=1708 RepID=A0A7Y0QIA2_CELFI|nr:hypothetical protein [Cellulomonas fimi]NMR20057.1 hypothetical protein [Cellulomonas fimi]